jgi:hypothetical protein
MDCYFRQNWRDARLSFQSPIKSLSLSIKVKFSSTTTSQIQICIKFICLLFSDVRKNVETRHLFLQC